MILDYQVSWFLLAALTSGAVIAQVVRRRQTRKIIADRQAYERGLEYARAQIAEHNGHPDAIRVLRLDAQCGMEMDPSPFDEAVLYALAQHAARIESENKIKSKTLLDVLTRLHEMEAKGEVSASKISGGLELLEKLLAGEKGNCGFFITEYLVLNSGQASIVRRPLADWPFWANNLNPLFRVQRVPEELLGDSPYDTI